MPAKKDSTSVDLSTLSTSDLEAALAASRENQQIIELEAKIQELEENNLDLTEKHQETIEKLDAYEQLVRSIVGDIKGQIADFDKKNTPIKKTVMTGDKLTWGEKQMARVQASKLGLPAPEMYLEFERMKDSGKDLSTFDPRAMSLRTSRTQKSASALDADISKTIEAVQNMPS